jgi:hypothetical protein
MIKKLRFSELVSTQFLQFFVRLLQMITGADPTKLKIILRVNTLNDLVNRIAKVIKQEQAYQETVEIKKDDDERDDAIIGYVTHVKSQTRSKKANVKAAAIFLLNYLNNLSPHIHSEDYSSESAILTKIYADYLTDVEVKNAIVTIGAQDWLTQINDANVAFEAKYKARTITMATDKTLDTYSDLRQPTKEAYYSLLNIIQARYEVALYENQDTTDYVNLINNMNALIAQTEQIIASTKPKGDGNNPSTTTPPTTPNI